VKQDAYTLLHFQNCLQSQPVSVAGTLVATIDNNDSGLMLTLRHRITKPATVA